MFVREVEASLPIIGRQIVSAVAQVIADAIADRSIGWRLLVDSEGTVMPCNFVNRLGVQTRQELADGIRSPIFGGTGNIYRAGSNQREQLMLIDRQITFVSTVGGFKRKVQKRVLELTACFGTTNRISIEGSSSLPVNHTRTSLRMALPSRKLSICRRSSKRIPGCTSRGVLPQISRVNKARISARRLAHCVVVVTDVPSSITSEWGSFKSRIFGSSKW